MTDSIAVLEDDYIEVVVNVMALELKCSSSRRCRETTHDDHELLPVHVLAIVCTSVTVNMNLGSVINLAKRFEGAYNRD